MAKILLVEDNELNRDMLSRRLLRRGFEVVLAGDGAEGFEMARAEQPDLVVMQAEASAQHIRWMRERPGDYSPAVRARLESGYAIPATSYLEVLQAVADFVAVPALATTFAPAHAQTPANAGPAPSHRPQPLA